MLRSLHVKDYMKTDLLTLNPGMDVLHATKLLLKAGISGAPVLDKHGRLVGMLTERDLMQVALQGYYHGVPGGLVNKHMSPDPEYVSPEQGILTLAEMFIKGKFRRYPVVDNGRLVGMIDRSDVVRAIGKFYPA
ncbi:MAG: CBS domain-containing protein [Xanthomonadales bacterium]|nr:CBS domain-containing protein [Gammaproteobacteria bacterium]MBT8055184.1 CBS domain-containing protein [Gammaproteobacteria bacterium]NND55820.1 CBS domain-containing protein [Xanthomonadales bacterium]NNK51363.1 CBS domain-containing protein [Xanthomonadales bacterium]